MKLQVVIRRQSIVEVGGDSGRGTFVFMLLRVLAKELDNAGWESVRADPDVHCHQVFDDTMKKWAFEKSEVARYPEVVVGEVGKQLTGDWASVGLRQRLRDVPPRVVNLFVAFGVSFAALVKYETRLDKNMNIVRSEREYDTVLVLYFIYKFIYKHFADCQNSFPFQRY